MSILLLRFHKDGSIGNFLRKISVLLDVYSNIRFACCMAQLSLLNEQEILAKIAQGDVRAFELIFKKYRKRVYTISLQYLHSELLAEDAVQEIFLKLWRLDDHLKEVRNLDGYLLQLTKFKCLNMLRRTKLEKLHIEPLPEEFEGIDTDTEDQILLNDTLKVVNDGIKLLPPQQKLVYQYSHIEGMKYGEIAQRLDIAPETARKHLREALKFLRSYVGKHTDLAILILILRIMIIEIG